MCVRSSCLRGRLPSIYKRLCNNSSHCSPATHVRKAFWPLESLRVKGWNCSDASWKAPMWTVFSRSWYDGTSQSPVGGNGCCGVEFDQNWSVFPGTEGFSPLLTGRGKSLVEHCCYITARHRAVPCGRCAKALTFKEIWLASFQNKKDSSPKLEILKHCQRRLITFIMLKIHRRP